MSGASRMVFCLAAFGTALIVKGVRPPLMDDANLDVDHADTEIPVETKSSILDEGRSQTESNDFTDLGNPKALSFQECLKQVRNRVIEDGMINGEKIFPLDYAKVSSDPTAWEKFKMCTKQAVPKIDAIKSKLAPTKVLVKPYMVKYFGDLRDLHGTDSSNGFEARLDACVGFKGDSQTETESPLRMPRDHTICDSVGADGSHASLACQRLYEKCLRNAVTDVQKVRDAIKHLTTKLKEADANIEISLKKPVVLKSLVEQLKHSVHDYNFHGPEEVDFESKLSGLLAG